MLVLATLSAAPFAEAFENVLVIAFEAVPVANLQL